VAGAGRCRAVDQKSSKALKTPASAAGPRQKGVSRHGRPTVARTTTRSHRPTRKSTWQSTRDRMAGQPIDHDRCGSTGACMHAPACMHETARVGRTLGRCPYTPPTPASGSGAARRNDPSATAVMMSNDQTNNREEARLFPLTSVSAASAVLRRGRATPPALRPTGLDRCVAGGGGTDGDCEPCRRRRGLS